MTPKQEQNINRLILSDDERNRKLAYHLLISQACTNKEANDLILDVKVGHYVSELRYLLNKVLAVSHIFEDHEYYIPTGVCSEYNLSILDIHFENGFRYHTKINLKMPVQHLAKKILSSYVSDVINEGVEEMKLKKLPT